MQQKARPARSMRLLRSEDVTRAKSGSRMASSQTRVDPYHGKELRLLHCGSRSLRESEQCSESVDFDRTEPSWRTGLCRGSPTGSSSPFSCALHNPNQQLFHVASADYLLGSVVIGDVFECLVPRPSHHVWKTHSLARSRNWPPERHSPRHFHATMAYK